VKEKNLSKPPASRIRSRIRHSSFYQFYIADPAREEWDSWKLFFRREWHWVLIVLAGLVALLLWVRPLPPAQVVLAVGPEHSALARLGERYVQAFAEAGVSLKLVYSEQAGLASALTAQNSTEVDAAFLVAGMAKSKELPDLVSLGSVEYAPLWIFYRGVVAPDLDFFEAFANGRFSIGFAGPVSRSLIQALARLRGVSVSPETGFETQSDLQMVERFIAGEIDVVAIVDGYDSHYVQQLVNTPGIELFDMTLAQAYQRRLAFLESLSVPRGSLNLMNMTPPKDLALSASTVSLLVDRKMHPSIQQLFLKITLELEALTEPFFARRGFFPAYLDPEIPLSPVARRFYMEGGLPLAQRLPYWLASLIDRVWLLLLGLLAVLYPLYRIVPRYRVIRSELQVSDAYRVVREIDALSSRSSNKDELQTWLAELDVLEQYLHECWIASESMEHYYILRSSLFELRARVRSQIEHLP
jgi:hypothetical protein